jgi:hypothetical protein
MSSRPKGVAAECRCSLTAYRQLGGLQQVQHSIGVWVASGKHRLRFVLGRWPTLDDEGDFIRIHDVIVRLPCAGRQSEAEPWT